MPAGPADSGTHPDLDRRQREMAAYLRSTAANARTMAHNLEEAAKEINAADSNADDGFADAMLILTNFMMNLRLQQAVKLATRYAAAEMKYVIEG